MAELMFKRGPQTNLPAIGIDGCFYLTTDTNRLYVGQGDNKAPVLLNQTVQIVASVSALPSSPPATDNDFYYCISENVLAIYRTGEGWTQINTNTDDTVEVSDIEFGDAKVNNDKTEVEYKLTLKQQKYDLGGTAYNEDTHKIEDLVATLTLKTADIAQIIPEAATVGLVADTYTPEASNAPSGVTIKTHGSGSDDSTNITFIPGANVDEIKIIDNDPNVYTDNKIEINVKDTTYNFDVKNDNGDISLRVIENPGDNEDNIHFTAGDGLEVSGQDTGDTITYTHKTYNSTSNVNVNENFTTDEKLLSPEEVFEYISKIEMNNGHVTNIQKKTVKMPFDVHLVTGVGATDEKGEHTPWSRVLTDNEDATWNINFVEDAQSLEATLKAYIDSGLAAANTALTFKGTINDLGFLPIKNVEIGDVYLLANDVSSNDIEYRVGDLFIAISKSGETLNGVLPENDIDWQYVPAGNELIIDTLFTGIANVQSGNGVPQDTENNGSASFHIEALEDIQNNIKHPEGNSLLNIVAGHDLQIFGAENANDNDDNIVSKVATIRHRDISTTPKTDELDTNSFSVTALVGLDVDNGHVTGITTKTYDLAQYDLSGDNNHIIFKDSADTVRHDIEVTGDGTWIEATVKTDENGNDSSQLKIVHKGPGAGNKAISVTNSEKLVQEGNLNIISEIKYDDNGHIVSHNTSTLTMPEDTTYDFYVANDSGDITLGENGILTAVNPSLILEDRFNNKDKVQLVSNHTNLSITGESGKVNFNMVWGTF